MSVIRPRLCIVAATLCFAAFLITGLLWARSYTWHDGVYLTFGKSRWNIGSVRGLTYFNAQFTTYVSGSGEGLFQYYRTDVRGHVLKRARMREELSIEKLEVEELKVPGVVLPSAPKWESVLLTIGPRFAWNAYPGVSSSMYHWAVPYWGWFLLFGILHVWTAGPTLLRYRRHLRQKKAATTVDFDKGREIHNGSNQRPIDL